MGDRELENRVRISEASGMVSVQAHCSFTEATALMKERARISHRSLREIADAVLNVSIHFGI